MPSKKSVAEVMYMGASYLHPTLPNRLKAWRYFLEAVLHQSCGVTEVVLLAHDRIRWSNGLVFFDTAGAPPDWLDLVTHLLDQNNAVIVILDGKEEGPNALDPRLRPKLLFPLWRTWEASEVRTVFEMVQKDLAAAALASP